MKKIFLWALIFIVNIIILEASLQILSLISSRINKVLSCPTGIAPQIEDDKLGLRPNPAYPGHDKKGFRNKSVPDMVDIVAMGDSHTYGAGVLEDEAWPQQLERLSGKKTYNMAFGGYSSAHSLVLLEEAIELKPKLIIEEFYSGNDLYDSYFLIYIRGQLPQLKNTNLALINSMLVLEKKEPLNKKITVKFNKILGLGNEDYTAFRKFLSKHSKAYGLLRAFRQIVTTYLYKSSRHDWQSIKQDALKDKKTFQILECGEVNTVFTSDYRLSALELDDPRINEGFRISLEAIRSINKRLKELGIDFALLLIPTKERVFKDIVYKKIDDVPEAYRSLIKNEELVWKKTKDFLRNQKIYFIDALPVLRKCIRSGNQPYDISSNGHPNPIGHRAIAELVFSEIGKHNLGNHKDGKPL